MGRVLICVAGMPGSGKSVVSEAARRLGVPVLVMGDVVREEATRRGLPHTPENLNMVATALRREEGPAAVARRLAERISSLPDKAVLIDGVRSLDEIGVFRGLGKVVVVAVHASPRTRFERLLRRGRPGDPRRWDEFVERDMVELGFGLGNVIALADYMIINEGFLEEARRKALELIAGLVGDG